MSLIVLCPSRSRPEQAKECYEAFLDTRHRSDSEMLFVIDEDDPTAPDYRVVPVLRVTRGRPGMTDAINAAASAMWDSYDIVGFVGDDHRFRTSGWDAQFESHLKQTGPGLIYANDLSRNDIPTQIFGSSAIWKALGWMALPPCRHLYLDNAWRVVGESINRFYYFPDVVIEHMHPSLGKGAWDTQYLELNHPQTYSEDGAAFGAWLDHQSEIDVERVRAAL